MKKTKQKKDNTLKYEKPLKLDISFDEAVNVLSALTIKK